MSLAEDVHVGTSGWQYDEWRGDFYPEDLDEADWFDFYAEYFETVEVNSTYYGLPDPETVDRWRERAPEGFRYTLKAPSRVTHQKKLLDPGKTLPPFLDVADRLGDALGLLLFQLPPNWHADRERLATFLEALPGRHECAFEFRHPSWYDVSIYETLRRHGATLCVHDYGDVAAPEMITSSVGYMRWHGSEDDYVGSYDDETLEEWIGVTKVWLEEADEVYVYFNNTMECDAFEDARRLREMVEAQA